LMHIIAAKAVALREAARPEFKTYQQQIRKNATALADGLTGHGFRLVSGGTDTHLILVDLRPKKMTGKVAEGALDKAGITVNKNKIPFDPEKPLVTSGIRMGTPALTTRGMKEAEMQRIADLLARALTKPDDEEHLAAVRADVRELAASFPFYSDLLEETAAP
ncbi:MAG: serine hydroxymethyltransferase, partial [Myxococcota bacterium]